MHERGEIDKNTTLWVSGGAGMFRRKIWEELGGLQELYNPFYWEDIDLSYRALKSGYKILFEKRSIVSHYHEEGIIKTTIRVSEITTVAYRNQFIFVWTNITDPFYLISHILLLPYYLLKSIKTDNILIKGFFRAVLKLPRILPVRRRNLKKFILTDKEILGKL